MFLFQISDITAQLGNADSLPISLHWSGVGNEGVTAHTANTPAFKEFR